MSGGGGGVCWLGGVLCGLVRWNSKGCDKTERKKEKKCQFLRCGKKKSLDICSVCVMFYFRDF